MEHKHEFVYGGIKYNVNERSLAGTSAKERYYFDWFYCKHCLASEYSRLKYQDTTFDDLMFSATPIQRSIS